MRNASLARNPGPVLVQPFAGDVPAEATAVRGGPEVGELQNALRTAEENEQSFVRRLHRVRDPKGIRLLRELRERIAALKARLSQERSRLTE